MSHHSSHDDERNRAMSDLMRQVFGEYPNGKLNPSDEGALAVAIEHEGNVVKIVFPKPVAWIGFTPDQAIEIAERLIKHARECGSVKPLVMRIPTR